MGTASSIAPSMLPELLKGQNFEDLLHAKLNPPDSMVELEFVLLGYSEILNYLIPGSLLHCKFSDLVSLFNKKKATFNSFFKIQGKKFLMSFLNGVNSNIARFVNSCWNGNPVAGLLKFEDLVSDVECGTFMNTWGISSAAVAAIPSNSILSSSGTESKSEKKPKKKQKTTNDRSCDCPDLFIENWGDKANKVVRKNLEE